MTDNDGTREIWSDGALDAALAAFSSDVSPDERVLATARAELMAAAGGPSEQGSSMTTTEAPPAVHGRTPQPTARRPRAARWVAAAAAVGTLVAGALVLQSISFRGGPAGNSAAASALNTAADHIGAADQPVGPGQFRYVATHSWTLAMADGAEGNVAVLQEQLHEIWVPADQRQEWLHRRHQTGSYQVIIGTEAQARAAGLVPGEGPAGSGNPYAEGEWRAPCGDFFAAGETPPREPCSGGVAGWQSPTPGWAASLPRDPRQLLDRLRQDAPRNDRGDVELLVYAADALRSGLLPADLRAALYRALALVPALRVTENVANLDGRQGTALGMDTDGDRHDIVIDVQTGQFIGERQVVTGGSSELPAGTITSYSSVGTAVVGGLGQAPAG
jgi:hypothetical protein